MIGEKMKTLKIVVLLAIAFPLMNCGVVRADLTPGQIVSQFNSLGTYGWAFTSSGSAPRQFTASSTAFVPDLSAYASSTSSSFAFNSFCVNTSIAAVSSGAAKLSYNPTTGITQNASGIALSVGGALLYQQYAAGVLPNASNTTTLASTIRSLNSATSINSLSWTTDTFLSYLLTLNADRNYWIGNYNVNQRYDEIGDYAVFIMNITNATGTIQYQDHLYVARADYGGDKGVPEPATLLLWALGSVGALGVGKYRRIKNQKGA